MGVVHETLPLAAIYTDPTKMFATIAGGLTLGGTLFKSFERVDAGDMGVMMCSGSPLEREHMTAWQRPKRLRSPQSLYAEQFTKYHLEQVPEEEI